MTQLYPDAEAVFKDSYLVDFLDLPQGHSEQERQATIIMNLKRFLLELGRDFAFVGEQYPLQVGGECLRSSTTVLHPTMLGEERHGSTERPLCAFAIARRLRPRGAAKGS